MKSYIHLYKTNDEFTAAYNGPDYVEPWLSLTEGNNAINYSKILTAITFGAITWVTDVPAKGGTATKDNCEFKVYANYDNGSFLDISSDVTVTGTLVVPSSKAEQRHEAGQLTLTASYGDFTATGNVTAYQAADFSMEPLTFNILSAGTINWEAQDKSTKKSIYYKLNDNEWTYIASNTGSSAPTITVNSGDKLQFRGNNEQYATNSIKYNSFGGSASFEVEGNIMSLIYGDDFKNNLTISSGYTFCGLFRDCTKLVSAENLILPATTLADSCYADMFQGCTSLTTAPELPANTLANGCYNGMFYKCTSLTTAPSILPARTLVDYCYQYMFNGCTSLKTAPELPATTLVNYCYSSMFQGCTSLKTAPSILPAMALTYYCYESMFQDCTSLTTAPELPANTLAQSCYDSMFYKCTSLTTAPALPANTLASSCYSNMFYGCTSLTTAPSLPADTLKYGCYDNMFNGCTSLITAPELPATTLADNCYQYMFQGCTSLKTAPSILPARTLKTSCYTNMFKGCTSLTTAPELPATTLESSCYSNMFNGCTSLNSIKCLATNISKYNCTGNWVSGVASTGTFVKAAGMTSWETGTSGIPSGWTIENA